MVTIHIFTLMATTATLCTAFDAADYDRHHQVSASYDMYWTVTETDIHIALRAQATAWVGIGLAELGSGSMPGSDMAVCRVDNEGVVTVTDMFATAFAKPQEDGQQDWSLSSSSFAAGMLTCEITRALDTEEVYGDRAILNNSMRTKFVFAHSADGAAGGSFSYHSSNRWVGALNLYTALTEEAQMSAMADYGGYVDLLNDWIIPHDKVTHYEDVCFNASDAPTLFTGKRTIMGAAAVLSTDTKANIHHFTATLYESTSCTSDEGDGTDFYVWTPGMAPFVFPETVGLSVGDGFSGTKYQSVRINIHYDNPDLDEGLHDQSGVRVYYTADDVLRPHQAAMLEVGDPSVHLQDSDDFPEHHTVPSGVSSITFTCPSNVTAQWAHDITILGTFMHMHEVGVRMETNVTRDGELVHQDFVDYFQFAMQAFVQPATTLVLKPGDEFSVTCFYNVKSGNVVHGLESSDEMCIDFKMYYPQLNSSDPFHGCSLKDKGMGRASITETQSYASEADIGRVFGSAQALTGGSSTSAPGTSTDDSSVFDNVVIVAGAAALAGVLLIVVIVVVVVRRKRSKATPAKSTEDGITAEHN